MAITHVKSNIVPDFTGTVTVYNSAGGTVTADASNLVRPSDWNSAHHIVFNLSGNTAGSSVVSGLDVTLVGGDNITLSADTALSRMVIIGTSGGGLTTAALSNHSHGNPQLNLTNLSGTTASNSAGFTLSLSAAAPGGGGVAMGAGTQTATSGTVVFANSNGLTFGMSGSNQITASHNGLTTAAASNHSHGNPQLNLTNLSGTTASNSAGFTLSLSAAAGGGAADGYNILAAGTQTANTTGTVVFNNSNGISFGMSNNSQITASYTVPSTAGLLSAVNVSAGTTSNNLSALTFGNANGVTFGLNASTVTASHNGLTTARASNDGVGLATALTAGPLAWTVNSAGISLNAGSAAGTGSGFTGNLISATITHNTAGLSLSFNHPAWLTTAAQSNHSHGNPTLALTNLTGTTASNSAGLTLSLSAAAPGAGAVNFSAGTTSGDLAAVVFSNSNGVSFGLNAGTITASAAGGGGGATTLAGWMPYEPGNNTTFSSQGQNSLYLQKIVPGQNYSFNYLEFRVSGSFVSSSNSQVVAHSIRYGLYSLDTNNSYNSIATSLMVISASYNSNTAMGYTVSQGAGSFTTTSGGTAIASLMSGYKHLYMPFTQTLSQGVNYAVGLLVSSATTVGTSPHRLAFWNLSILNNLTVGKIYASTILASNTTFVGDYEQGVYATTTGVMPAAVAKSQMTQAISNAILFHQFEA